MRCTGYAGQGLDMAKLMVGDACKHGRVARCDFIESIRLYSLAAKHDRPAVEGCRHVLF
jgi:TPR repeat protein